MPYRHAPTEQIVLAALESYLKSDPDVAFPELDAAERQVATRFRAVPLFRNTFETLFLCTTGAFIAWSSDPPAPSDEVRVLDANALDITFLLATGAQRHPALAQLLPPRPARAADCYSCGGAGYRRATGPCLVCKGLGWTR